jgi:hypothetical protein
MGDVLSIPGYAAAVLQEQFSRDVAFLGLPESVAGFDLVPITLRHYVVLRLTRNPLLTGGLPSPRELFNFLWLLSPHYNRTSKWARRRFELKCRRRFYPPLWMALINCRATRDNYGKRLHKRQVEAAKIIDAVKLFVEETMQDAPPKLAHQHFDPDYYSDPAFFCALFGREYGWTQEQILDMPMRRLFQYLNEIKQRNAVPGKSVPLCNPSDRVKASWMRSQQKPRNGH